MEKTWKLKVTHTDPILCESEIHESKRLKTDKPGSIIFDGRYEVLVSLQGYEGGPKQQIGNKNTCRFCRCSDPSHFKKIAHTFPEALGNKWITSRDECDSCNAAFSSFENELINAVKPLLTLGGIKGKRGVVQTGRSNSSHILRRKEANGLSIRSTVDDFGDAIKVDPFKRELSIRHEIDATRFVPRLAYKALTKMAVSILPHSEVQNYSKTLSWLQGSSVEPDFPKLEVALSFGSVMNAPPVIAATLLRRVDATAPFPHILFMFCAGSICFQIDLRSDHLEDHLPPVPDCSISINWKTIIGGTDDINPPPINYSSQNHFNWSTLEKTNQPIKSISIHYNLENNEGHLEICKHITPQLDLNCA